MASEYEEYDAHLNHTKRSPEQDLTTFKDFNLADKVVTSISTSTRKVMVIIAAAERDD